MGLATGRMGLWAFTAERFTERLVVRRLVRAAARVDRVVRVARIVLLSPDHSVMAIRLSRLCCSFPGLAALSSPADRALLTSAVRRCAYRYACCAGFSCRASGKPRASVGDCP